jgi:hypothetical protein
MQPNPDNPTKGNSPSGPALAPPAQQLSPQIQQSQDAFRRDLPQLLRERYRQWVAYHGDERIGFSPSKRELYQECLRRGLQPGTFVVRSIEPEVPREVDNLADV